MIFNDNERNNNLRTQILQYHMSAVMTDDERAQLFGLPRGCRMRENAKIIAPENFECGEYVWIGEGAILDASGGLKIGDHTSVGLNVMIWSHSSHLTNLAMNNIIRSPLIERKPTIIGKGCFIAGPSVINSGVNIGDKVIILPMSVVTKDIPSNNIVAGAPAIIKRKITESYIQEEVTRVLKANKKGEINNYAR